MYKDCQRMNYEIFNLLHIRFELHETVSPKKERNKMKVILTASL